MFPGVIELARLQYPAGLFGREARVPLGVDPGPYWISNSPGRTESGDDRAGR